jgi:hypothetical protein
MKPRAITTLFIDIGGVLLTNGWDHLSRKLAAKKLGMRGICHTDYNSTCAELNLLGFNL